MNKTAEHIKRTADHLVSTYSYIRDEHNYKVDPLEAAITHVENRIRNLKQQPVPMISESWEYVTYNDTLNELKSRRLKQKKKTFKEWLKGHNPIKEQRQVFTKELIETANQLNKLKKRMCYICNKVTHHRITHVMGKDHFLMEQYHCIECEDRQRITNTIL